MHRRRKITIRGFLQTGQVTCHDTAGHEIPCPGTGQDAEFRKGIPWPESRFEEKDRTILDLLTGLVWTQKANLAELPVTWQESLDYIASLNSKKAFGYSDWRLPNRRELRSLISHQTRKPALTGGHPFLDVFPGWYWTSTTAAIDPSYAWYVHMEGGRMFYGGKEQSFLLWPVRGRGYGTLSATGQTKCYDRKGNIVPCTGSSQDGEFRFGFPWPDPRFKATDNTVIDRLTGLCWLRTADLSGGEVTWSEALEAAAKLNSSSNRSSSWRLPNINELESLVDCSSHSPALPFGHLFREIRDSYWSSTTSMFEPDWAWALYLIKGAVGVGQKRSPNFYVWPVCDAIDCL